MSRAKTEYLGLEQNSLTYSREGQSALAAQTGWRKAVGVRFDIHEAMATAEPYSVSVVAYASDFLYRQGFLCYRVGHEIRLLDVHGSGRQERTLNLNAVLPRLESGPADLGTADSVTLVYYSDGIIAFRVKCAAGQNDLLVVIDMARRTDQTRKRRLLLQTVIPADCPLFVRHSRTYIWYGTFAAVPGSTGVWSIQGHDFDTSEKIKFRIDQVLDGDLGQTACFEMIQDHLYVVATQLPSNYDDTTSFYHWLCHAPREKDQKWEGLIWRREHREGPVNELWLDLAIRTDETTGRPVIVECRREWRGGRTENHRTIYIETLPTPDEAPAWGLANREWFGMTGYQYPFRQRPEKRLHRNYHDEFEATVDYTKRQEFIALRTKHHTYDLAASTFIDLVNDPTPQSDGLRSRDNLRLRTVSRKRKCPFDEEKGDGQPSKLLRPAQFDYGQPVEGSEERFVTRGVHLWPAPDAPSELKEMLSPTSRAGPVRAISDERSLIYSVPCAGLPQDENTLVLISFDPTIRFPTFTSLCQGPIESKDMCVKKSRRCAYPTLLRDVRPLYQGIGRGYWLR